MKTTSKKSRTAKQKKPNKKTDMKVKMVTRMQVVTEAEDVVIEELAIEEDQTTSTEVEEVGTLVSTKAIKKTMVDKTNTSKITTEEGEEIEEDVVEADTMVKKGVSTMEET